MELDRFLQEIAIINFLPLKMKQSNCQKYKNEPEMEYLNSIQKKQNSLLKLEKDFRELKDRGMKMEK